MNTSFAAVPVEEWGTPFDAVEWLHQTVLTSPVFNLAEWEQGQQWAEEVDKNGLMTERDASIILEFARFTIMRSESEKLSDLASELDTLLNGFIDVQSLHKSVSGWAQKVGSRIGQERTQAICRIVYLGRRWPR
jgi:hypothetical protein